MTQKELYKLWDEYKDKDIDDFHQKIHDIGGQIFWADWKEFSDEAREQLKEVLAQFDIETFNDPAADGSDTYGLIFFKKEEE